MTAAMLFMKHDSIHRASLYMNPSLAENIITATHMTGNLGHVPVPVLQVPVKPFPRVTPLEPPGSLGLSDIEPFELALNFASILVYDASPDGRHFPRNSIAERLPHLVNWTTAKSYCYDMIEVVRLSKLIACVCCNVYHSDLSKLLGVDSKFETEEGSSES
jgi:hypothetical protein